MSYWDADAADLFDRAFARVDAKGVGECTAIQVLELMRTEADLIKREDEAEHVRQGLQRSTAAAMAPITMRGRI